MLFSKSPYKNKTTYVSNTAPVTISTSKSYTINQTGMLYFTVKIPLNSTFELAVNGLRVATCYTKNASSNDDDGFQESGCLPIFKNDVVKVTKIYIASITLGELYVYHS